MTARTTTLAPYLPRLAVEWAGAEPERRWRRMDGSLVFVDISGFTALSERLARKGRVGAEELTATISSCFEELLAVAYAAGGSLIKFGGDALLLLFDGDGHATRACTAARQMRTALKTVGHVRTTVGSVRLRMSVGIHSGAIDVFRVGSSHKELIITGPGATATVTMESTAEAGEILVSSATAALIEGNVLGEVKGPGVLLRNRAAVTDVGTFPPLPETTVDLTGSVPVSLRDHLLAGTVEAEHRHATVGFVHFDGVDALIETEGPEFVADALDELVSQIQTAADDQGVTFLATDVDRDGGKVILVAGAPQARDDDEGGMLRALRRVADGDSTLPVRIGVNRGHVFVGEVGPAYRRTYTVMGDAVNLAARLMAKAEPGQIIATNSVIDRARTTFAAVPLPPFMVKGKSTPIEAYAVGAVAGSRAMRAEAHAAADLPFAGRAEELATLHEALASTRAGRGKVVEVTGVAGMGKSRLVQELLRSLDGTPLLDILCEPYEARTPYFAVGQLLRDVVGIESGANAAEGLRAWIANAAPALLPWLPLLADVVGATVPETDETARLEPRFRRERTIGAVVELARTLLVEPTVFVVEDAHWMDDASAQIVAKLAGETATRPWLICVIRRAEAGGLRAPDGDQAVRITLAPLDDAGAAELLAAATRDHPLPPHQRAALIRQAGGNPLFLEELARGASLDGSLPESLEAVVAVQIDRLPPTDRRLLRYASVLGATFEPGLLSAVLDDDATPSAASVGRRLRDFVEPAGRGRLRFRNQCFRDVAYDTLPFRRRKELHSRAGDAIERLAAGAEAERAEVLSEHFLYAQAYDRCWHYARMAAAQAAAKYANVEAADLYDRALAAAAHLPDLPRVDVAEATKELGTASNIAGMYGKAKAAYARARKLRADDPVAIASLCIGEARIAERQGSATGAVRWLRRGLRLLEGSDAPEALAPRGELLVQYAYTRLAAGKHREVVRLCEEAIPAATASGNRRALANAYMVLDMAHRELGQPELATHAEAALEIWEEIGDLANQAVLLINLGVFAYWEGRWAEALDLYARGREACLRAGNVVDAAMGTLNVAELLIDQGRLDEAEPALEEVADLWRSVGYEAFVAFATWHLGRVAVRRGDYDRAEALLSNARDTFSANAMATNVLEVEAWLAECWLRQGDVEGAVELVNDAIRREEASGGTLQAAMLHRLRGYAYAGLGRVSDAWAEFDESLHVARTRKAAFEVALTLEAISVVAELGGLPPDHAADEERRSLLAQLGVRWTPPPPITNGREMSTLAP